ncbi:MAG: prenyltransferase/squalene oxidase repeat-containing protein [Thermoplasmatota archaeon]
MNLQNTLDILDSRIEACLIEEDDRSYLYDPYFDLVRNRVSAEYCKGLMRLDRKKEVVRKIVNFLLDNQNDNGSWNELHPKYNETSSLVTSIVGDALLGWYRREQDEHVKEAVESAKNYVMSCEEYPGFFIKSRLYYQDHLNVDATCADFLSAYSKFHSESHTGKAAERVISHIRDYQFKDGVFPYRVNSEINNSSMDVPCIHYQGVTIYYIFKTMENLGISCPDWLSKGIEWLSKAQKQDGSFDWSKSGLMFAYRLTGAYAFAYSSYNIDKERYSSESKRCLKILEEYIDDLMLRWEKGSYTDIIPSLISVLKSSSIRNDALKNFLHKVGYGTYREFSRRRYTENPSEDMLFEKINDILSLHSSTIEPSRNYPDLFMTTECFDCLTYSYDSV